MNNKVAVVYKSKTGFAKKYAQWISEELKCDLKENNKLTANDLEPYDIIIYGGGLYAVGINGIKLIKDNFEILKKKKLIVFATGATPPKQEDINKVWDTNFDEEQKNNIERYYFRGGFDFDRLHKGDKFVMTMMKMKLKNTKNPTEDESAFLSCFDNAVDFTDKKNIEGLVSYVRGI